MQHLQPNSLLQGGKYKIEKVLGQGSFGITYLAEHTALGKKVCIKEFFMKELNSRGDDGSITGLSDGSLSYNYAQKFRKEAQNLARLEHPNIVRVTDCFDENGTFYYVMDYIDGENLNDYIKKTYVDKEEAVNIIKDVAKALLYMHNEMHMLHLDLKPGNIMRRKGDGHIFLIDFGLSKHYSNDGQPETSTTIGLGTAGYAPIEQSNQAKNGEFRPTIDVYALGATLYKLLTRETPPAASELVTDDELISINLKEHGVSEKLISVVCKAMLPNVRKRIQTVEEFVRILNLATDNLDTYRESTDEATIIATLEDETQLIDQGTAHNSASNAQELYDRAMVFYNQNQYDQAFPLLKKSADMGYAPAQYRMAISLACAEGVQYEGEATKKSSITYLQKAAAQGHSSAMLGLGLMYLEGNDVEKNIPKGIEWVEKAVAADNSEAKIFLAVLYLEGKYVSTDINKGNLLITSGVQDLLATSQVLSREQMSLIGICYLGGLGVIKDGQQALRWLQKAADKGDPQALYMIGDIHLNGIEGIVASQPQEAVKCFKLAAEKQDADSLVALGDCYLNGWGLEANQQLAFEQYKKAAELHSHKAYLPMGTCYHFGYGVKQDYLSAIRWYKKAVSESNSVEALNYIGLIYDTGGCGVVQDKVQAKEYYKQAAEQGFAAAQYNYGITVIEDCGDSDYMFQKGFEWVKKAAEQNFPGAVEYINSYNAAHVASAYQSPTQNNSTEYTNTSNVETDDAESSGLWDIIKKYGSVIFFIAMVLKILFMYSR